MAYNGAMSKYTAKLTGESDRHTVTKVFGDKASALAWLQGEGLADFDDQTACGEVISSDGHTIWTRARLQTPDIANRGEKVDSTRLLARYNLILSTPA
jgi:hypothetical protein